MRFLQIFALWFAAGASFLVGPLYPPNAISGGTVVAELHVVSGNVKRVSIDSGEEPFVSAAKAALAQWHLHPERDGDDLVVVHFRQPNLYYVDNAGETIGGAKSKAGLPYPRRIVGPAYPAQSLGQGSVILRVKISASGSVEEVKTLKSAGVLTGTSIDAVKKWQFLPAEDDQGLQAPSYAYAVIVYRVPLIEQKK